MASVHNRDSDPLLGQTIADKYRVVSLIARGGMGRVYRATQLALERDVALKVLNLRHLVESGSKPAVIEDFRRRFVLEAASAAKLTHPNTIVIHDYGSDGDDLLYMVMELVDGETLADVIERSAPLSPEGVVRIMSQVCGSLTEAHGRGMVHRDLKPSNIMLTKRAKDREFVKVLDFGLVKQEEDVGMTQSGALIGTPRYMSPEQVAGSEVTAASDIYGLGACMYHALTGQPPFDSESKYVLMAAHMNVVPTAMAEVNESLSVPSELEALVMRCLRKEPSERFQSMEDVALAMQAAMGEDFTLSGSTSLPPSGPIPLGRLPSKGWTDSLTDTSVSLPNASVSSNAPPLSQRLVWIMLALLVAVLAGAFYYVGARRAETDPVASAPAADPSVSLAAPGTAPEPAPVDVTLSTEPSGARVMRGGEDLGNTPAHLRVAPGETWSVELRARGYVARTVQISAERPLVNVVLEAEPEAEEGSTDADGPTRSGSVSRPERTPATRGMAPSPPPAASSGTASMGAEGPRTDNRDPWGDGE